MLLKITGLFFVGLAVIGAILPLMPTTVFLLIAATCFAKSSPYLYNKLLDNKTFGPLIYHWQQSRSIPIKAKVIALSTMALSVLWSCYMLDNLYLRLMVAILVLGPFIFLYRLPLSQTNN